MLIVGAYPDSIALDDGETTPIAGLTTFLNTILPAGVAAHVLPFYPAAGDFGFAVDDWFSIRPSLGTWSDIEALAFSRALIVDGIYNHVGIGHHWVQRFVTTPESLLEILHAYRVEDESIGPLSPRGQPVLRRYDIRGETWHVWQTFSEAAIDIRLDNQTVLEEIDRHLGILAKHGVWGVRLDAVAYYAKFLGSQIRHNPGVFQIADSIAQLVEAHGMRVLAQLDCDADGQRYFSRTDQSHYVIGDFTYAVLLALAILSNDPVPLSAHLVATRDIQQICLRAPRTHDGLLLRSGLLAAHDLSRMLTAAAKYGLVVRTSGGAPYELNCSAPFLYSLASPQLLDDVIELAIVVTGMTSGWSYFYLPFIMGHIPENDKTAQETVDPRELNRRQVPLSIKRAYLRSTKQLRLWDLLTILVKIHGNPDMRPQSNLSNSWVEGDHLLCLIAPGGQYKLLANFSNQQSVAVPSLIEGDYIHGNRVDGASIAPFGYGIWRL